MLYEIFAKYWHKRLFLPPRLTLETNVDESSFRFNYIFVQRSAHTLFCNKKKKKKSSLRQERAKKKKREEKGTPDSTKKYTFPSKSQRPHSPRLKRKKFNKLSSSSSRFNSTSSNYFDCLRK